MKVWLFFFPKGFKTHFPTDYLFLCLSWLWLILLGLNMPIWPQCTFLSLQGCNTFQADTAAPEHRCGSYLISWVHSQHFNGTMQTKNHSQPFSSPYCSSCFSSNCCSVHSITAFYGVVFTLEAQWQVQTDVGPGCSMQHRFTPCRFTWSCGKLLQQLH